MLTKYGRSYAPAMGSTLRSRASRRKFGGKRGKHAIKSKKLAIKKQEILGNTSKFSSSSYHSRQIGELRLRITKDAENSHQLSAYRQLFYVRNTLDTGKSFIITLQKKKTTLLEGYRLMDLQNLSKFINIFANHVCHCTSVINNVNSDERFEFLSDCKRFGMASILSGRCNGCHEIFYLHTSTKVSFGDISLHDVNARAVWGSMVTGKGCESLNEQAATFDMPGMTGKTFTKIENCIGKLWEEMVNEEMLKAGAEERRLAIEREDFDDGIPAVTIICDGGWSKRSHKHSYNALGGVGIIIGALTHKILYMGIRNKNCYVCTKYNNRGKEIPDHECFKNWSESSQAMESDIILQGFLKAERMHGVRFMRLVGDGDSSVYSTIQEQVPVWGCRVRKIECANHICKCLRSRLEQLVIDNPHYKGKNNLTKSRRVKLVSVVRAAIAFHFSNPSKDRISTIGALRHDILNAALHVFGDHQNCTDFCKSKDISHIVDSQDTAALPISANDDITDEGDFLIEAASFWTEGMSEKELDASRFSEPSSIAIDSSLHRDIQVYLNQIADKAEKLLENATTNLAESWMNMRMKFDGGKVVNRCCRGSWGFRCYGALLRQNMGPEWAPLAWEKSTGMRAGRSFDKEYLRRKHHLQISKKTQQKKLHKVRRWKKKIAVMKKNTRKKAMGEYGPGVIEETVDISDEQLAERQHYYYEKEINVSEAILQHIEKNTREQSLSSYWIDERKKRLTASNFSTVVKRRPSIPVKKLVERLLYSSFAGTRITRRGLRLEKFAIVEYTQRKKEEGEILSVDRMGLYIDRDHPFLGASVDGIVQSSNGDKGILEVKHVLFNKLLSFQEAATKMKSFCLEHSNGQLHLKKSHPFYYQIQGQLNVLKMDWADLVVRRVDPYQLHIERISRDITMWNDEMLPKLTAFYTKALLPELAVPRNGQKPGIREPGNWFPTLTKKRTERKRRQHIPSSSSSDIASDCSISPPQSEAGSHISFLHRHIVHEWEDEFGRSIWYNGYVDAVIFGSDGDDSAVYEVVYEGDEAKYEVYHTELTEDFKGASLKFVDEEIDLQD